MTARQLYNLIDKVDWETEVIVDGKKITDVAVVYDSEDNVRLEIRTKEKTGQQID